MSTKATQNALLHKLLLRPGGKARLWVALLALFLGLTMFLASVLLWWNFNELLHGKNSNDALSSSYLVVAKQVTDVNMGNPTATLFTPEDIAAMSKAPLVQDVGAISSNRFPVYAMMGGELGFATEMPLECVPDEFLDNMPRDWKWTPGDKTLPIIISSQFLDIYNYVFAPGQGLPQLSESTVKSLSLRVKIGNDQNGELLRAHVVAFSDRIGSVVAPRSFIEYGNATYSHGSITLGPSQLILRVSDPSDTRFAGYLQQQGYRTNPQNLRWSRIRSVVNIVALGTGVLAILIMGISLLVVVLFIQLTIAKAAESLSLLRQLGYGPGVLSRFMTSRFLPVVSGMGICAMLIILLVQFLLSSNFPLQGISVPPIPGMVVWGTFVVAMATMGALVSVAIRRAI